MLTTSHQHRAKKPLMSRTEDRRENTRNYVTRRRDLGEKQVTVWVPQSRRKEIQNNAWQMRVHDKATLPGDHVPDRPAIQIPTATTERPESPLVGIESGAEEKWLHKLLTANGGEWDGRKKIWMIREDVATALGLGSRMVEPGSTQ